MVDPFTHCNVKYQDITGQCPLSGLRLRMFKEETSTAPDDLSVESFGGDVYIQGNATISFETSSTKRLKVTVGEYTATVRRVSGLPGTDRMLRPSHRRAIPSGQKRFYRKLTEYLNGKKVYLSGPFNCYTALTGATHLDYDIKMDGDRPFPVSVDHTEVSVVACPEIDFSNVRKENCKIYHPHGSDVVNIANTGDPVCYFGASVEEESQRCQSCDSASCGTRVWQDLLFDGTGQSAAIFYPDCVTSMRRMECMVGEQDRANWKRARAVLTPRPEVYVNDSAKFAEHAIYGGDLDSSQGFQISHVPSREEVLLRVVDDARSQQRSAKDICMVYRNSEPERYRKDLLRVRDLDGIFYDGGYSHPYLDGPRRWNIAGEVAWPSVDGALSEPLPADTLVGGEGHRTDEVQDTAVPKGHMNAVAWLGPPIASRCDENQENGPPVCEKSLVYGAAG